jgi:hypothetical protein
MSRQNDSTCCTQACACGLVVRHGCGFLLWNTSIQLPSGVPYTYHVPDDLNVLQIFSDAMEAAGLGHGFYCPFSPQ